MGGCRGCGRGSRNQFAARIVARALEVMRKPCYLACACDARRATRKVHVRVHLRVCRLRSVATRDVLRLWSFASCTANGSTARPLSPARLSL